MYQLVLMKLWRHLKESVWRHEKVITVVTMQGKLFQSVGIFSI